ncbi:MAG: ATP-binding protein [Acidobacteria bacterium]|nr:ATP-binding protein [Acidobacteriota bacterium]
MPDMTKGRSPFYPGQPVPVELFVGRAEQIRRIMERGVGQVAAGKPVAMFVQGEYGIGKSSIAGVVQRLAENGHSLHSIYAPLGGARTLEDVAAAVLEATLRSGAFDASKSERVRNWLAKYIGQQELFGFTLNAAALKQDAPQIANSSRMLGFLGEVRKRLEDRGVKGVFLALDEINGLTRGADFAHFIKGLVDTNAMSPEPLPLLLMLCGVEERRREMIEKHRPVERIFDVVEIESMRNEETEEFFRRAFDSEGMSVEPKAMGLLVHYSAGFPKIMHLLGDNAYWADRDGVVSAEDAIEAVAMAAEDVGTKYVDQQVYGALRSADYRTILAKIARLDPSELSFTKGDIEAGLTQTQKLKLNNFLQKMKRLKVLRSGELRGEYVFTNRMVRLYIWLKSQRPPAGAS